MTRPPPAGAKLPPDWAGLIHAPLDDGKKTQQVTLLVLSEVMHQRFRPQPVHIQVLLHLATRSAEAQLDDDNEIAIRGNEDVTDFSPSPISVLYRLLDVHYPRTLAPLIPQRHSGSDIPPWLDWLSHGTFLKAVHARMAECQKGGVWALLWEEDELRGCTRHTSVSRVQRGDRRSRTSSRTPAAGRDDDADDDRAKARRVSSLGWDLLEWLVSFWEKDAAEREAEAEDEEDGDDSTPAAHKVTPDYGAAFVTQLYRSKGMASSDTSAILAVVRQAYLFPMPSLAETMRRRSVANRLLALLVRFASGPRPPIVTSSVASDVKALLSVPAGSVGDDDSEDDSSEGISTRTRRRGGDPPPKRRKRASEAVSNATSEPTSEADTGLDLADPANLSILLRAFSTLPWLPRAHILTLALEGSSLSYDAFDARSHARQKLSGGKYALDGEDGWGAPSLAYALDLVRARPFAGTKARYAVLGAHLVAALSEGKPGDAGWEVVDDEFVRPLEGVLKAALIVAAGRWKKAGGKKS